MIKWLIPIVLAFTYSCASISADWTPWKMEDVPSVKRKWHICREELDGPDLHLKGFCYQSEECRSKKIFLGSDKKECRRLPLVCLWGDVECIVKFGINSMEISNR